MHRSSGQILMDILVMVINYLIGQNYNAGRSLT